MARIAATGEWTFRVQAPRELVYGFFADPNQVRELLDGVESVAVLVDGSVRWVLKERVEMGVHFRGDYTTTYHGNGVDHVHWHSLAGNMGNEGDVWLTAAGDSATDIRYRETVEPDLPVTIILARIIRTTVERELRAELEAFVTRVQALWR